MFNNLDKRFKNTDFTGATFKYMKKNTIVLLYFIRNMNEMAAYLWGL